MCPWRSFKLPFNTNKTCYMCTSFMPKAQIKTLRMVQSLKTLLFMLSFPKFLSMDTFLFYSLYKDIMDQPVDLQSHTQSPQAFWSATGRQERLWRIRKKLNFLTGCPLTVCIVLLQKSCGKKIPVPESLPW